jgi:hypothetical protein
MAILCWAAKNSLRGTGHIKNCTPSAIHVLIKAYPTITLSGRSNLVRRYSTLKVVGNEKEGVLGEAGNLFENGFLTVAIDVSLLFNFVLVFLDHISVSG